MAKIVQVHPDKASGTEGTADVLLESKETARGRLREIMFLHPDLEGFLRSPETFSTEVERVSGDVRVPNDLDRREHVTYVLEERQKFITPDAEVAKLLRQGYGRDLPTFLAAGPRENLAFDPRSVNVGMVVAGGTAPGTNAILYWIAKRHEHSYGLATGHLYGFLGGFRGLARKGDLNMITLHAEDLESHLAEPGCLIGMSRYREESCLMVDTLAELCLDILYVIGGDGTLEAGHRLAEEVWRRGLRIAIAGIPKTIDNDIVWCWRTFGFATAVQEAAYAIRALHANIRTHSRIGLMVLYGGHSGYLAANAGLASGVADAVVIPEEPVTLAGLLEYATKLVARRDRPLEDHALFVIAEGVAWSPSFREQMQQRLRVRGITFQDDHLDDVPSEDVRSAFAEILLDAFRQKFRSGQHLPVLVEPRSLISSVVPSAEDITYCQRLAYNAVDGALAGFTDFMSSFWLTEHVLTPLSLVAGQRKEFPVNGQFWSLVRSSTGQPAWV